MRVFVVPTLFLLVSGVLALLTDHGLTKNHTSEPGHVATSPYLLQRSTNHTSGYHHASGHNHTSGHKHTTGFNRTMWGGAQVKAKNITSVTGTFTVPRTALPPYDKEAQVFIWIGTDGSSCTHQKGDNSTHPNKTSGGIQARSHSSHHSRGTLQAGLQMVVNRDNSTSYNAVWRKSSWVETFPKTNAGWYEPFPAGPGDEINVHFYRNNSRGNFVIKNLSRNNTLLPVKDDSFGDWDNCTGTARWMIGYTGGEYGVAETANFTLVKFSNVSYTTGSSAKTHEGKLHTSNATNVSTKAPKGRAAQYGLSDARLVTMVQQGLVQVKCVVVGRHNMDCSRENE